MAEPPPRMTSQQELLQGGQSIPIAPGEVAEVQRFLEQMRAQKAMQASGSVQQWGALAREWLRAELKLVRDRVNNMDPDNYTKPEGAVVSVLSILEEHIKALE